MQVLFSFFFLPNYLQLCYFVVIHGLHGSTSQLLQTTNELGCYNYDQGVV